MKNFYMILLELLRILKQFLAIEPTLYTEQIKVTTQQLSLCRGSILLHQ